MNLTCRTIFIISGDLVQAQRCFEELASFGGRYRTQVVGTVKGGAEERLAGALPPPWFLDQSAIDIADGKRDAGNRRSSFAFRDGASRGSRRRPKNKPA